MRILKRLSIFLYSIFLLCFFVLSKMPLSASASAEQNITDEINEMVQEHMDKAKITSVSIAFIQNGEATYLSYGENSADKLSLYQIGSTTKAFTALGVLWLEDEGLLSLDDPVSWYIPWLTIKHDGVDVPIEDFSIANLLYQTSGFTNDEARFPSAEDGMTLEDSVRALVNCELAFYPSTQYAYANANYNVLGLLIEIVSGQSYQDFMAEKILSPLGLGNTYSDPAIAEQTGTIVKGSRLAFFQSHPYEIPVNIASIPAGYILSDIHDMSRWIQIHMGLIEVTDQFARLVSKAHIPDKSNAVDADTYYASGWFVQSDGTIYHSGGTPNYSSRVMFNPDDGLGVCVLTNINASANTEMIAENVMAILEGQTPSPYQADIWTIIDTIFSILTFICTPLLLFTLFLLIRSVIQVHKGGRAKRKWSKKAVTFVLCSALLVVLSIAIIIILPITFGSSWQDLVVWAPYSLYTGTSALTLFSITLFAMVIAKSAGIKVKGK